MVEFCARGARRQGARGFAASAPVRTTRAQRAKHGDGDGTGRSRSAHRRGTRTADDAVDAGDIDIINLLLLLYHIYC